MVDSKLPLWSVLNLGQFFFLVQEFESLGFDFNLIEIFFPPLYSSVQIIGYFLINSLEDDMRNDNINISILTLFFKKLYSFFEKVE